MPMCCVRVFFTRFPLPPRSGAKRVRAKGFFKGATVVRGRDWIWKDQDGEI